MNRLAKIRRVPPRPLREFGMTVCGCGAEVIEVYDPFAKACLTLDRQRTQSQGTVLVNFERWPDEPEKRPPAIELCGNQIYSARADRRPLYRKHNCGVERGAP